MKSERGWRRLYRRRFNSQIGTAFQTPKTDQTGLSLRSSRQLSISVLVQAPFVCWRVRLVPTAAARPAKGHAMEVAAL
jgi:hypothetical protein